MAIACPKCDKPGLQASLTNGSVRGEDHEVVTACGCGMTREEYEGAYRAADEIAKQREADVKAEALSPDNIIQALSDPQVLHAIQRTKAVNPTGTATLEEIAEAVQAVVRRKPGPKPGAKRSAAAA